MSLTTRVLVGLGAGLGVGLAVRGLDGAAPAVLRIAETGGTVFVNAIRMTVVPLVAATLIASVARAPDARTIGALGGRALVLFVVLLTTAALFTVALVAPLIARIPIDPAGAKMLRASAPATTVTPGASLPSVAQWVIDLLPANAIRAAADGAILPLILFAVLFGLALTRVATDRREVVVRFFEGVSEATIVLVGWVLALAPIGVFALAIPIAARLGASAAGALASYVALVSAACIAFAALVLYPLAVFVGRKPLKVFARGSAPAQAVAFGSRSSLASLPAMITSADTILGFPHRISAFYLPLAASTFRVGGVIGQIVGALFVARLYGYSPGAAQVATIAATAVLTTFSIPGIPGGSIFVMVPVLLAAGIPADGVGLLLGVDTIPDMFRTTANVTGTLSVGTVLTRVHPDG
ncbi:MAG: dicarboxylate/amino acid:cation symporter [Gemmatimonadaceae bacterium]